MTAAELLIHRSDALLRAAVVADGRLTDLHIDRDDRTAPPAGKTNPFAGRK